MLILAGLEAILRPLGTILGPLGALLGPPGGRQAGAHEFEERSRRAQAERVRTPPLPKLLAKANSD